jgi:hypothetical protein
MNGRGMLLRGLLQQVFQESRKSHNLIFGWAGGRVSLFGRKVMRGDGSCSTEVQISKTVTGR